jgi:hypothetical protein
MGAIVNLRIITIIGTASLLAMLVTELKIARDFFPEIPSFLISLIIPLAGGLSADLLARTALRFKRFRKLVMGSAYVEGHWFLITSKSQGVTEENPLERPGVLSLQYILGKNEVKIVTTRLVRDEENTFPTESDIAYVQERGPSLRYLNYFYLNTEGLQDRGVAEGSFSKSSEELDLPDTLQSTIVAHKDGTVRTQVGYRINDYDVHFLAKQFGRSNWIAAFLNAEGKTIKEKLERLRSPELYKVADGPQS